MADRVSEMEALRALEARLERATETAERLLADAADAAEGDVGDGPPPRGWRARGDDDAGDSEPLHGWLRVEDAELLLALLAGVRDRVPADLQRRLAGAARELLLALRALIDWCLERAERRQATPAEVQDIPIL